MFPSHTGMKLEINNKKFGTFTKMRKLSNTLSITNGSKNKTTREIRKYFEMKENENTLTKIYGRKLKQWRIFALSVLFEILKNAFKGNQFFKVCNCRKLVNSSLNGDAQWLGKAEQLSYSHSACQWRLSRTQDPKSLH